MEVTPVAKQRTADLGSNPADPSIMSRILKFDMFGKHDMRTKGAFITACRLVKDATRK